MSDPVEVVGGVGGLEAQYDDLDAAARVLQSAALDAVDVAVEVRGVLTDTGLVASAVLDPGGFARTEAAVLAAVLGPHGLVMAAGRLEQRSLSVAAAVLRYIAADRLGAGVREARHWAEGTAMLLLLPAVPLLALSPVGAAGAAWLHDRDVNAFLAEHPGIAEDVAGAVPAFLDGLLLILPGAGALAAEGLAPGRHGGPMLVTSLEDAAGLVAMAYPVGRPQVVGRGVDTAAPPAPRSVTDLLAALGYRDQLARSDTQGEIDVRRLTRIGADGVPVTSWIVDLPGTKEWQLDPRRRDHLNDLATNLDTMAGDHSARVDGVMRALEMAGVGKDEPVMLVGHSQGGLVAMRAAEECARSGAFSVTHVVTAGSPIARIEAPPSVSVLALENRYDLVPQLDGRPPPPQTNRVTVLFDTQSHDVGVNHALRTTYLPAGRLVDERMHEASLAQWRAGAAAFLAPDGEPVSVRTTVWDIRNDG